MSMFLREVDIITVNMMRKVSILLFVSSYFILDNVLASTTRLPKLIAGNWKMNPVDLKSATKLAFDVAKLTKSGI